ncbi:class I SAM-dependent methyltransferase [Leptospira noguchii]|uniref:class I SAM-dependent methyltransferase n=1 Tax=Leptospira noguchii TaxID=28182 RepID=UPI000773ED68|nr:class I SAM-dependent methyltransferase [Leptospira noguchii]UOG59334.1 class I SAM-dependent methyltransferase [Leptospira noguchii]
MEKLNYKKEKNSRGFISTTPLPDEALLKSFYRDLYYQAPESSSYQIEYADIEIKYKKLKFNTIIYAIQKECEESGKFLDIGAGEGFLMQAAHQHGFSVTGIDFSNFGVGKFNPEMSEFLKMGDVYGVLDELIEKEEKFTAISAVNVLEHVLDPDLFFQKIKCVLEPKGIISITVPNDFSDLQNLALSHGFIDREFWFAPPAHLHYFNTKNLPEYCNSQGFKVVDSFSDFPIDIFLFHPKSNYVMDPKNGSDSHRARMLLDLLIYKQGIDKYLAFYRSMFEVGIGRDITVLLKFNNV